MRIVKKCYQPVEYWREKKVSVFDIAETAYEPRDYMTDYEYSDFPTLEMSEVKLLWNNEEKCIQYTMAGDENCCFIMRLHLKIVI